MPILPFPPPHGVNFSAQRPICNPLLTIRLHGRKPATLAETPSLLDKEYFAMENCRYIEKIIHAIWKTKDPLKPENSVAACGDFVASR